ncbi:MAG: alpha/beta hydrolase [Pseudomonadota bacterium]|nr:alpha/beta hydrolase [Pseudomonadota bacterium]
MFRLFRTISIFMFSVVVASCGGGSGGNSSDISNDADVAASTESSLSCVGATAFDPIASGLGSPIITSAVGTPQHTTIILMHGKTGSPYASFLESFQSDLAALGYKVIAPFMPWSSTTWQGSLCEGMAYINSLASPEIAAGQDVVLAGHSMGAAYSLMYGVTQPSSTIKAIISIGPGHFMHVSNKLQSTTASDVTRARELEANDSGDVLDTFVTLNGGSSQEIATTATRYLSFHDLERVPNVNLYAQSITLPVLWISGSDDPLTTNQNHQQLAASITSVNSEFQLLSEDHQGVVALTPNPINTWLQSF